jgi:hypothetical protein
MLLDYGPKLLPEEDALDDPNDEHEPDPTVPGDLWFAAARCWPLD